jgi:hypothetical protein
MRFLNRRFAFCEINEHLFKAIARTLAEFSALSKSFSKGMFGKGGMDEK